MSDFKGFRPGVRIAKATKTALLLDLVEAELAKARAASALTPLSALELIELGAVHVDDARSLKPDRAVNEGSAVRIHVDPRRFNCPSDLASRILAEDAESLLVEKPADLPVEPTVDNVKENLVSFLEDARGQSLFLVHRLAPESEGLLLLAKNQAAANSLARAFAESGVRRVYAAYTEAPVALGEHLVGPTSPEAASLRVSLRVLACEERQAATGFLSEGRANWVVEGEPLARFHRVEIESRHARPKEVRLALAERGAPVIGDRLQGSHRELKDADTGKATMAFRTILLAVDRR